MRRVSLSLCGNDPRYNKNHMTAQRSTKEARSYSKKRKEDETAGCPFCAIGPSHAQYVTETKHLKVIRNRTPYSLWDSQGVLDHLMVVPKQHTGKLGDLGDEAAREFIALIDQYEEDGYAFYGRAPGSAVRSVAHQHTHLLKLDGKKRKFLLMIRQPWYIRLSK